jgi:catechol 2,3-dioxygenase-like lactoylglutathione lyase family enzyme
MIKLSRVGHATFETPDLDRAIAYYTDVNGLVLNAKDKSRAFLPSKIGLLTVFAVTLQGDRHGEGRCRQTAGRRRWLSERAEVWRAALRLVSRPLVHARSRVGPHGQPLGSLCRSVHQRSQLRLAGNTTTTPIEHGSLLNRKSHVMNVALNIRRGLQRDGLAADHTCDFALNDHLRTGDRTRDLALLANDDLDGVHIPFDLAIDLKDALADDLEAFADDLEVVADYRFAAA